MAIVTNKLLDVSGGVGNMSFVKRRDFENIILRSKGGATRKQIQKSPKFELTRLNNDEFGDAAKGGCYIRRAIFQIRHLADYNFTPTLNALCRSIMRMDTHRQLGLRMIEFSACRHLLDGFNLNKRYPFNTVVKPSVFCTIDRNTATATVQLPELTPGINLTLPWKSPMYRIVLSIGIISDGWGANSYEISNAPFLINQPVTTPWRLAAQAYKAETLVLQPDNARKLKDNETLIVSIGIEMGTLISDAVIERVKHTGSGKILLAG